MCVGIEGVHYSDPEEAIDQAAIKQLTNEEIVKSLQESNPYWPQSFIDAYSPGFIRRVEARRREYAGG